MRQDKRWELFECQRCGKCCVEIGLPYDPKSIFEIAHFLDLTVHQVIKKYYGRPVVKEGRKKWKSEDYKRTPCPFIKTDGDRKACAIYRVRPEGCRLYPFQTVGGRADVDCPGVKIVEARLEEEEA